MSKERNTFMIFGLAGGHPHNWNAITGECLSLLTELNQRLVSYHDSVATNGRAKSLSTASEKKTSSETSGETFVLRFYTLGFAPLTFFLVWFEKLLQVLKIQWVQGRHYCWKPRSLCLPAPLPAPQRALWRHRSLLTWTAHLRLPPCVDLPLLQNNARRGRAHCRAHMWWGEVWSSGPHPQVGGYTNHHDFILHVTLGIKFTLEVRTFGLVLMSIWLRIKTLLGEHLGLGV